MIVYHASEAAAHVLLPGKNCWEYTGRLTAVDLCQLGKWVAFSLVCQEVYKPTAF